MTKILSHIKIRRTIKKATIIFSLLIFFAACDPGRLYDESRGISENGWHKDSLAEFIINVTDTTQLYNFYITVRNNDNYTYRNLYLFLNTRLPNSNLTRDTIELVLADVNGKWLGKGFGAIKDNQIPVRNNLIFPIKGEYIFGIEQAMREETLVGLVDIGIRVEQAK
jgi:gliding motility-associated lipoprotein GldH